MQATFPFKETISSQKNNCWCIGGHLEADGIKKPSDAAKYSAIFTGKALTFPNSSINPYPFLFLLAHDAGQ